MFGRATIRLGIGPHSSYSFFFQLSVAAYMANKAVYKTLSAHIRTHTHTTHGRQIVLYHYTWTTKGVHIKPINQSWKKD